MLSIGELARRTGVKVPTIRYYEQIGLLAPAERSRGNQRRYPEGAVQRLDFIRHARALGFGTDAIAALIALQDHPDRSCADASAIATAQLDAVRAKIAQLRALELELARMTADCTGSGSAQECAILATLADHGRCVTAH